MMGCCNYHIHIFFPDSAEQWLVRIPRPGLAALHRKIDVEYQYASEFATLKFLEGTKVPAPKVFAFDVASNTGNAVGTTYLIMEFLAGTPFNPHSATLEEKKRVYDGVAEILIELSKHPLPKACSLAPTGPIYGEDGPFVAKIAGLRSKIAQPFGPFETAKDYHMAIIEAHLSLIEEGTLYPEHAVEAYLTYSILQERISELYKELESFYLTHIDAKGDHILLSPSGHISGIIDWQGARFSPYDEAFGPSLLTADLHALYFGRSGTTPNDHLLAASLIEKGEARLADAMKGDERARRFHFGLGSARMEREMWDSIRGLLVAFEIYEGEGFELWRERAMARYRGDLRLERLLERSGRFGDESQVVYLASRLVTPVC
ncbi:hypothetical protein BKA66DRAFT_414088 [Pyrenochaeta sp. MPI-SDFR-AT-0127]|nr:hypothetical protein BKA66DRAFT_414088 [Pyrenochaeta sp. MPI-SDFR-AT-0127]